MNLRGVLFLLGRVLLAVAVALLVPALVGYFTGDDFVAFLYSAGIAGLVGISLERVFRQPARFKFGRREAFLLVTAAWITASLAGAIPYVLIAQRIAITLARYAMHLATRLPCLLRWRRVGRAFWPTAGCSSFLIHLVMANRPARHRRAPR